MLRTDGPNALSSAAYAEDFNEIKALGSLTSTKRTADETAAAIFWQDSGSAIWNRIYRDLAASEDLDVVESARLYAMTNLAAADGAIGCWNDKWHWSFWRPITAVRAGGNGRQSGDGSRPELGPAVRPDGARLRAAARDARVPRSSGRSHVHQLGGGARASGLLRHRQGLVHGGQQQVLTGAVSGPALRSLLGGAQGDHRRSSLGRHPLPHGRRPGLGPRQEGGALPREALLPASELRNGRTRRRPTVAAGFSLSGRADHRGSCRRSIEPPNIGTVHRLPSVGRGGQNPSTVTPVRRSARTRREGLTPPLFSVTMYQ